MKQNEIKELATADLAQKINELEATLGNLKLTHKIAPIENPFKIRETRRTVARLYTELRKRELDAVTE